MDLSKLPRLSKTDTPAAPETAVDAGPGVPPQGFEPVMVATSSAPAAGYCRCGAPLRAGARFCDSCGAPAAGGHVAAAQREFYVPSDAGVGAEVWLSAAIGLFLMMIGRSFGAWLVAKMTGQPFNTGATWVAGEKEGQPVGYWELEGFAALNDSAIFLFGMAMVLEAAVLALVRTRFKHKAALVTFALLITVVATAFNLFVTVKMLANNTLPLWSALAVAFGGYIAVFEWRLLNQLRGPARAA